MKALIGLYREKECSPGRHQTNDAVLLEQVAAALRARGVAAVLQTLDQAAGRRPDAPLIFSMCQSRAALDTLSAWERAGARIVNSPRGARNTYRDRLPALMAAAHVPFPATTLVATAAAVDPAIAAAGVWLKRGDLHASISADVQRIAGHAHLATALASFAARGIDTAAVQAHCAGDEIKFYGVNGGFFHWFYSGRSAAHPLDVPALERLASRAAEAAGLDVYGGDVIVGPGGALTLIDLNDWPSFAPCREAAAGAIGETLTRRMHAPWYPALVPSANQSAV